jgi:predicted Zn-dependent protease
MRRGDTTDDRQIQDWLDDLRVGTDSAKVVARRGLARIFEQRGMLEEAADLLTANIKAGPADGATYRWLAQLYRARGEVAMSEAAAAEASRLLAARYPPRATRASGRAARRPDWRRVLVAIVLLLSAGAGIALSWLLAYFFPA